MDEIITYREALRQAMADEMSSDKDVILLGEDIGVYGGCFNVTGDLYSRFPNRVIETPVSEEGFTGMAVGAAMMGMRPVVEIMYADFFTLIFDPIVNHAAKTHFMSGGQFTCPITVRLPEGSGTGHGAQHTQSPEALFMNSVGLKMVAPSSVNDAYHLLRASIRDNNPVLFFEHKLLYGTTGVIGPKPMEIGKANVLRRGTDITLVSYSHAVKTALETAENLMENGISSTVVDLCSLKPLDSETVLEEIRKTGRAAIIQDPSSFGGVASQVCSMASSDSRTFRALKAPILVIGGNNSPVPFSAMLEKESVPDTSSCVAKILELLQWA